MQWRRYGVISMNQCLKIGPYLLFDIGIVLGVHQCYTRVRNKSKTESLLFQGKLETMRVTKAFRIGCRRGCANEVLVKAA